MFAYCNNNPVLYSDSTGHLPFINTMMADSAVAPKKLKEEYEFRDFCRANGIHLYNSMMGVAEAWARENREKSSEHEYMSYIYEEYGLYFYTDVYEGASDGLIFNANVIMPTLGLELRKYFIGDYHVVAQIHSHPAPPKGMHNDFPSADSDIYGGDRIAYEWFNYSEMFIVPYGQQIIDWSKTTWHGMQRMIERGVTQNMVGVWTKTGKASQQAGDKILYITKQGAVVIDIAGKVITAYTSQYFDPAMQEVVEKLFGK